MEIQLETQSPVKKVVNIVIDKETVDEELSKEIKKVRKKANVKGFRKGKVPISFIKKMYGDSIKYEVLNKLLNDSISKAITENKINYIGDPEVKDVSDLQEGTELKITAEFHCIEDFEPKDYKGIKIELEKLEVTDDIFEKSVENVLKRFTYFEDVEDENTPIEEGYQVVASIEAFIDNEKYEPLSKDEIVLTIGENQFLPGFDSYFIGLTKNDETEVTHIFEKDNEKVEGKFLIKVKWIKKPVVPELNEEFISQFGEEYKSVEEFKDKIRKDLEANFEEQMREIKIEKILEVLRNNHDFQYPELLLQKQIEFLKSKSNFYRLPDEDDESFEKRLKETAEKQIRNSIILEKIERIEDIKPTEEDINKEFEKLAAQFRVEAEKVKEFYMKNTELSQELLSRVSNDKIFDFLIENADITYTEKKSDDSDNKNEKSEEAK